MAYEFAFTILVTGADGQLGRTFRDLSTTFTNCKFIFTDKTSLPITDETAVDRFFSKNIFDVCINCAAYTAVDMAEDEQALSQLVNTTAPALLAKYCAQNAVLFIHISTDYVFNGKASTPYTETDETDPVNFYGYSKQQGEEQVFAANPNAIVIRTSWVYSQHGKNFVKTMCYLLRQKEKISVVADQWGSPTAASNLAEAIMDIIVGKNYSPGIYHYCNQGIITWHQFAVAIKNALHTDCIVAAIGTIDYPTKAARPAYSALDTSKIKQQFSLTPPQWEESLKKVIAQIKMQTISANPVP